MIQDTEKQQSAPRRTPYKDDILDSVVRINKQINSKEKDTKQINIKEANTRQNEAKASAVAMRKSKVESQSPKDRVLEAGAVSVVKNIGGISIVKHLVRDIDSEENLSHVKGHTEISKS